MLSEVVFPSKTPSVSQMGAITAPFNLTISSPFLMMNFIGQHKLSTNRGRSHYDFDQVCKSSKSSSETILRRGGSDLSVPMGRPIKERLGKRIGKMKKTKINNLIREILKFIECLDWAQSHNPENYIGL